MLQAEADHRRHAIIEQVIADLKNGPLAHLPAPRIAGSDDAMVAKLSLLRNKIHGGDLQVEWTDASDVTQLLRRYVTLAGQHFAK